MLKSSYFRQQAAALQYTLQQQQSAGWLKRLFAWLILGLALMVGFAMMMVVLLLSWLLIPLMIYRARKRIQVKQNASDASPYSNVIEGEIVDDMDNSQRR